MKAPRLVLGLVMSFLALSCATRAADSAKAVPPARTQVFALSEVDRPPALMFAGKPIYPPELKAEAIAGEVVLECVVDLDGSVRDPVVKSSTRKEFEAPALRALDKSKFRPGMKGKEKVNVRIEHTVKFDAPKK